MMTTLVRRVATFAAVVIGIQIMTALARRVAAVATVATIAVAPVHSLLLARTPAPLSASDVMPVS